MSKRTPAYLFRRENIACMSLICLLYVCFSWQVVTEAVDTGIDRPEWANPTKQVIKKLSPVPSAQNQPVFMDNLDCTLIDYRLANTNSMTSGCFTETALGMMDPDSSTVIFNGTDEGLPIYPFAPNQIFAPWPRAANLISLEPANTGGSYISLYKNPVPLLQDQRNYLLQLKAKKLTGPPDLILTDKLGQRLVVNAQTLAFSDGGGWLIAETTSGSFVRMNLATLNIKPFAPSFVTQGSPGALKSRVSISASGRFVAIYNDVASTFRVYDLDLCIGSTSNLQPESCPYHDYLPFVRSQISGLQNIYHVRFINEGLITFQANTTNPDDSGIYEFAPTEKISSLIDYLGLGDSYASGEGAFNYLSGTDNGSNMCHLSVHSYPLLLTGEIFNSNSGHSVACSGAVITDIGNSNESYKGQIKDVLDFRHLKDAKPELLNSVMTNFIPGYLAQERFVNQYQPSIITVNIGGNDIGFGDILEQCVSPKLSRHISDNTCFATYEERQELLDEIDRYIPKWKSLFSQLHAKSPDSSIYAIGYPKIASDEGNCALNVQLGKFELEFSLELVDHINTAIQASAKQANINYIDITDALNGHRLCEAKNYSVAINGLTTGKDGGPLGIKVLAKESYHPNALGHELVKEEILKQTHNFTKRLVVSSVTRDRSAFLAQPKSGQPVATRVPIPNLAPRIAYLGKTMKVKVEGLVTGLKPKTMYSIQLSRPQGQIIGTTISNDSGDIDATVVIPESSPTGGQTIDITGDNQVGQPVVITQPIYIAPNESDLDDDGLNNDTDSCPVANNSGEDSDQDGTDDACDGIIGLPPTILPNPTRITIAGSIKPNIVRTNVDNKTLLGAITLSPMQPSMKQIQSDSNNQKHFGNTQTINKEKQFLDSEKTFSWLLWLVLAALLWLVLFTAGIFWENYFSRQTQAA